MKQKLLIFLIIILNYVQNEMCDLKNDCKEGKFCLKEKSDYKCCEFQEGILCDNNETCCPSNFPICKNGKCYQKNAIPIIMYQFHNKSFVEQKRVNPTQKINFNSKNFIKS